MSNLTDVYNQLSAADAVYLEKHAAQVKIAEEEDAAGRIMARGFADELTKLATPGQQPPPGGSIPLPPATPKPVNTGANVSLGTKGAVRAPAYSPTDTFAKANPKVTSNPSPVAGGGAPAVRGGAKTIR